MRTLIWALFSHLIEIFAAFRLLSKRVMFRIIGWLEVAFERLTDGCKMQYESFGELRRQADLDTDLKKRVGQIKK